MALGRLRLQDVDQDRVADGERRRRLGVPPVQLTIADDPFALRADVDQDLVAVDAHDRALDHVAVLEAADVRVLLRQQLGHGRRLGTRGDRGLGLGRGRLRDLGGEVVGDRLGRHGLLGQLLGGGLDDHGLDDQLPCRLIGDVGFRCQLLGCVLRDDGLGGQLPCRLIGDVGFRCQLLGCVTVACGHGGHGFLGELLGGLVGDDGLGDEFLGSRVRHRGVDRELLGGRLRLERFHD